MTVPTRAFASTADLGPKTVSFDRLGEGLYAYTAEGDPNSGIIVGDDGCMVIDAQATPAMAADVIARVRAVTDKPIRYVLLSHYHAVRVLGASAYEGATIIASDATRGLIVERGEQDKASEIGRFPRLFPGAESIPPGLTWPHVTFGSEMTVWLGRREVKLMHLGRGHTAGDTVAWVPDAGVAFTGDLVEYHSACYCGDAHFKDWPKTLAAIEALAPKAVVPGRGAALTSPAMVADGIRLTRDFLDTLYGSVAESVAKGLTLKQAFDACGWRWTRNSAPSPSMSIACPSTSRAPMTMRAASTGRSSGRMSATARCGRSCRAEGKRGAHRAARSHRFFVTCTKAVERRPASFIDAAIFVIRIGSPEAMATSSMIAHSSSAGSSALVPAAMALMRVASPSTRAI